MEDALSEAGVGGFENAYDERCSTFFGAGCSSYTDLWDRLQASYTGTPSPPPPPMLPFDGIGMYELPPTRIFFDGGLASQTIDQNAGVEPSDVGLSEDRRQRRKLQTVVSSHEYITASTSAAIRCVCTDGASNTLCMGAGSENAWIMFDLGEPMLVHGVEIVVYHRSAEAPSPPPAPPPRPPPSFPPDPPMPPRPPPIDSSPSPPPYPAAPPRCNYLRFDDCIVNFIDNTNDGICDDSGVVARDGGLIDASTSICQFGHDFSDCGERCDTYPPPNPPPPPHPPPPLPPQSPLPPVLPYARRLQGYDPAPWPPLPPVPLPPEANPGALEVWASDVSSFFGYKTATLQNGISSHIQRTPVDYAYPARYWSLRSYNSDARLRLDSLRFYGTRSNGDPPIASSESVCDTTTYSTHPRTQRTGGEAAVVADEGVIFPGLFVPPPNAPPPPPPPPPRPPPPIATIGTVSFLPGRRLSEFEQRVEEAERTEIWKLYFQNLSYPMPQSREQLVVIIKHFFSQDPETEHLATKNVSDWPQLPGIGAQPEDEYDQVDESVSDQDVPAFDMDSMNWWNNIEVHTIDTDATGVFNLYPLRLIPNTMSISPAASLVTALALTNSSDSGEPDAFGAEAQLLESACRRMGGCEYRSIDAPLLHGLFEFDHPRSSSTRDDGEWAAWALSATVAPVIHAMVTKSLICAAKLLCGELCDICDGIMPPANAESPTPAGVVRAVETAIVGDAGTTVDVASCVQDAACVADASERAAASLKTVALPMDAAVKSITDANKRLWDEMRSVVLENATSYSNFTDRMVVAMDAHREAVGNNAPPEWARQHAAESGRRLQEQGQRSSILASPNGVDYGSNETLFAEWYRSVTDSERLLFATSATAAHELMNGSEHIAIVQAHLQAMRAWALVGAHVGTAGNYTGVCADPHIPNRTISCRAYFALMGRELQRGKRRMDEEREFQASGKKFDRRRLSRDHHRQLKESVEEHLENVCCAEFESDGRIECGRRFCEHHVMRNTLRRMGHVLRKLNEDGAHPAQKKITPDVLATLENYILPELHEDPQCRQINRSTLDFGGPTRWECMGKSLLKHAAKKHGLDAKTIEKHMNTMGMSIGKTMQSVHKVTGVIREVRGSGDVIRKQAGAAAKLRSEGAKRATELIRSAEEEVGQGRRLSIHHERSMLQDEGSLSDAELARREAVTRGTVALPGTRVRGFAHAARRMAETRRDRRNASKVVNEQFRRLEEREHRDRLERAAAGRAGHTRRDKAPHYDSFHWDNFKQHVINPVFAFEALQAEHGSLSSRLRGGLSKLSALSGRWSGLNFEASLVDVQRRRQRQRRLAESDGTTLKDRRSLVRKLYEELDRRQAKRAEDRRRRLAEVIENGRRLREDEINERVATPTLELPERHALSFLHEIVDWGAAADEWTRVKEIVKQRNQMRYEGRSMKEILEHHPTGYSWLDDHARYGFTKVGDAFRRMWHRKTNGTDAGHVEHVKSKSDHAGTHHPERHGRVRRLAESFLGPAVSAPYALWDTVLFPGTFNQITVEAKPTQDNIFVAALRYVVFSTVGCYLTEPNVQVVGTQKSNDGDGSETVDGSKLKVLKPDDTWMCFPAIPFMLPRLPTWREFTKSEGIDYTKLTYEEYCTSNGFQERTRDFFENFLGMPVTSETARLIGIPGFLRGAEAMDSVKNFVDSAQADEGDYVIGFLFCGIVEFGGVVYVMIVLFVLTIAFPLIQIFNTALGIGYDLTVLAASPVSSAVEANIVKDNKKKRKDNAKKEAKKDRKKESNERKKKEKKEKAEKKKKENKEKKKKKKKENDDKKKKKKEENAKKAEKKKEEKSKKQGKKKKKKGKETSEGAGTPTKALRRLETRMDRLDRRLTRAAMSSYAALSALREFTIRELVQLRQRARENVQSDLVLFDGLRSVRSDIRRRDADNVRSDLVIYRSLDQIRDRVRQLDAQLKAAMAAADAQRGGGSAPRNATRVLTSRTGDAVAAGIFSNVYAATVGRVFGSPPIDYGEVTTTTSDEDSSDEASESSDDSGTTTSDSEVSYSSSDESSESEDEEGDAAAPSFGIEIPSSAGYAPTEAERRGMMQLQNIV